MRDGKQEKVGKIGMGAGGALYFDQAQELSMGVEAKLVRVVEERSFERLGGTRTIEVDVRVVSSSSVDLREAVGAGRFREDLFHRLNVVPLKLPPLRNPRGGHPPPAAPFPLRRPERGAAH